MKNANDMVPTRRRRPRLGLAVAALCVALLGCGHGGHKKPSDTKKPEAKPTQVTARGFVGRWLEKVAKGHVRKVMEVHSAEGALDSRTNSGTLYRVDGTVYREGLAKARFTAPEVLADRNAQTLIARQGVVVKSIDPPGATIRCQTMTWRADLHRIVAEGSVFFDYSPPGSGHSDASGGPFSRITVDTELQNLTIP